VSDDNRLTPDAGIAGRVTFPDGSWVRTDNGPTPETDAMPSDLRIHPEVERMCSVRGWTNRRLASRIAYERDEARAERDAANARWVAADMLARRMESRLARMVRIALRWRRWACVQSAKVDRLLKIKAEGGAK
jgi:hypothetical protein